MRQRNPYRYALVAGIALFGFLTLRSLFQFKVQVGAPTFEIKRFEHPSQYWFFTGACFLITATGVVVLVKNP